MAKKCVGCGVELQNTDKNLQGYTPKPINTKEDMYCQRCFQLKHYGKYSVNKMTREDYKKEVGKLLDDVKLVIAVFDIIDFEGSFDVEILDILREKDSIVIVNKLDLIPDEKHPSEVANWVKDRLAEESIAPLDIAIVSTKNGYGVNGVFRKIKHFYPDGVNAMVIGVTNVGKSSVINRLLGKKIATVSKYPGTTIKNTLNMIPFTNIGLYDTPGLFSIYAAKDVQFHETTIEKAKELEAGNFFTIPCDCCKEEYNKHKKVNKTLTINTGEELVFKGLAWVSVKRGPLNIQITLPEEIEISIRKAFINPRR